MAYATGNNTVRRAYDQAKAAKTRIAPHNAREGFRRSDTGLARKFGTIRDKERIEHESGQGKLKPTHGPAPQYEGKGRRMTTQEKKHYTQIKAERGGTFRKPDDTSTREGARANLRRATTVIRKPGVGVYTSRAATAEDLNRRGKLSKPTPEKQKLINRFKR